VVDPDRNGLLVPVRDPAALAAAMRARRKPSSPSAVKAAAARAIALARFDERQVVSRVMATYRDVARRKESTLPGLR
jgi:glycosyltransferase involved in cell wall biosynthesis